MTLMFAPKVPSRQASRQDGTGLPSSIAAQELGRERPGDRPAEPQGLGVQKLDRLPYGGVGALQTGREIADYGLVDGELAIGAEFDDQRAKQMIVGRRQLHNRHRAQPRAEV